MDKTPAQNIITFLKRRKGFAGWWADIDEDNQEEIIQEMAEIIDEYIEFNWR